MRALALSAAALLLGATGWHGGELVYRYGLGVLSLPAAEGEGHDHVHADGEMHEHESTAESPPARSETLPAPTAESSQKKTHVHKDGSAHEH